jgi:hypothetical protein
MRQFRLGVWAALVLTAAAGCGAGKPVVSGLVTLDGQPLDHGDMQFFPVAGDGQTSFAFIGKDGRYRAEVSPTKMKVVIHLSRVVNKVKKYADIPDSPMVEIRAELLPPRYSDMNKTELIIDPQPGENTVDFKLKSDPKK